MTHTASMSKGGSGGTLAWKAPEEFDDAPFNEKCDVYSFSILIWEILTRETPWSGLTFTKIMMKVGTGKRPEVDEDMYTNLYGKGMVEVMKLCWAQDPDKRPTFAEALRLLSEHAKTATTFFDEAIRQHKEDEGSEKVKYWRRRRPSGKGLPAP